MIVDTSALIAITFREPGHRELITKLADTPAAGIGTPTLAETGLVLAARLRRDPRDLVVRLLDEFSIEKIPFGDAHWKEAVDAYLRFGKGRHKAQLNFGDCMTYAVARLADEPLLSTGNDFTETDLDRPRRLGPVDFPGGLFGFYAARPSSRRARWLVRRRSSGVPVQ